MKAQLLIRIGFTVIQLSPQPGSPPPDSAQKKFNRRPVAPSASKANLPEMLNSPFAARPRIQIAQGTESRVSRLNDLFQAS